MRQIGDGRGPQTNRILRKRPHRKVDDVAEHARRDGHRIVPTRYIRLAITLSRRLPAGNTSFKVHRRPISAQICGQLHRRPRGATQNRGRRSGIGVQNFRGRSRCILVIHERFDANRVAVEPRPDRTALVHRRRRSIQLRCGSLRSGPLRQTKMKAWGRPPRPCLVGRAARTHRLAHTGPKAPYTNLSAWQLH